MNIYAIFALVNAFTSGIITTLVLSRRHREPGALGFVVFSVSAGLWSAGYVAWQVSTTPDAALLWVRIFMVPAILIPCGFYHFVATRIGRASLAHIITVYAVAGAFIALDWTPHFVARVTPQLSFAFWPEAGSIFGPFLALWFGLFVWSTWQLIRSLHGGNALERGALRAVLFGVVIGLVGGATNFPLWFGVPIPPVGNALVSVYVLATGYAIVRHHLFNVRVISVQILVFGLWSLLLGRIVVGQAGGATRLDWVVFGIAVALGVLLIRQVLRTVEQQAELARLLAARKEFLDVAAHQLRSPVTDIVAAASVLAEGSKPNTSKPLVAGILGKSRELAALINDYLDAAALDTGDAPYDLGRLERVDLRQLIETACESLRPKADRARLALRVKLPVESVWASTSPARLDQALRNLIENAIRYTPRGIVTVTLVTSGDVVTMTVADTGIGIPAEFLPKLFTKFGRATNARETQREGSGLGLFIAKRIIEAHHGGRLMVASEVGVGTTFTVTLGLAKEAGAPHDAPRPGVAA